MANLHQSFTQRVGTRWAFDTVFEFGCVLERYMTFNGIIDGYIPDRQRGVRVFLRRYHSIAQCHIEAYVVQFGDMIHMAWRVMTNSKDAMGQCSSRFA